MDLSHEILKPGYVMCNECINLDDEGICKIYGTIPPKNVLGGNPFKEKYNKEVCKKFEAIN